MVFLFEQNAEQLWTILTIDNESLNTVQDDITELSLRKQDPAACQTKTLISNVVIALRGRGYRLIQSWLPE